MMRRVVRDLWVDALENGRFTQCDGVLSKGGNRRCVLGVLCEVIAAMPDAPDEIRESARNALAVPNSVGALPPDVALFAGFPGEVTGPLLFIGESQEQKHAIADLNDNVEVAFNFGTLARLIREQA